MQWCSKTPHLDIHLFVLLYSMVTNKNVEQANNNNDILLYLLPSPLQLKVIASTEGRPPEKIEDEDLGFATEAGFKLPGVFDRPSPKIFALLFVVCSAVLGISTLMLSSKFFINFYKYVAEGRSQFGFYFFALAVVAFCIDIAVIITEWQKLPQWCGIEDLTVLISSLNETGCDNLIIIELSYQGGALLISLISAIIIAGSLTGDKGKGKKVRVCLRVTYTILVWGLLFLLALIAWSIIPTLLMAFVYPSIVISVAALILALIFWVSVLITVPPLMAQNLRKHVKCRHVVTYLIPLGGLFLGLLAALLLTLTYLQAAVWGSGVGGAAGLVVAIAPGLALTFVTEFYRDWFLTRIIGNEEGTQRKKDDGSIKTKGSSRTKNQNKSNSVTHKREEPKKEGGGGGGGEEEGRKGEEGTEMVVINVTAAVENGKEEAAGQAKPQGDEEEEEEEEVGEEQGEDEEETENKWTMRRTREPVHLFQQGLSRIYHSGRRKKDKKHQ